MKQNLCKKHGLPTENKESETTECCLGNKNCPKYNDLYDKWSNFHRTSELPRSAICTHTYFDWWVDILEKEKEKAIKAREEELIEMIYELEHNSDNPDNCSKCKILKFLGIK